MAATDDEHTLSGIGGTRRAEHVGNSIGDGAAEVALADRRDAACPHGIGVAPSAGRVDHGPSKINTPTAIFILNGKRKRMRVAFAAHDLADTLPRNCTDARRGFDDAA